MSKLPFMQFYPGDWIQDTQRISLSARGAWITLLCQMWIAPCRGVVDMTLKELKILTGLQSDEEIEDIVVELDNVADIEEQETGGVVGNYRFTSRRMIRDEAKRKQLLEADKRYNVKRTSNERQENVDKTSKIYQKSEVRSHISDKDKEPPLVVPDWIPSEPWEAYLRHRKHRRAKVTPEAAEGLIQKLLELKKQGEDITAVLRQSVTNGWTGLFPVSGNGKGKPQGQELAHTTVPA